MTRHPDMRPRRPLPASAAEDGREGRYRWVVLAAATFTQAASGFFVQGIGAMGVQLQAGLDLSAAQLGLLLSAAQLAPLAGLLVAGELLDRYDERWVVGAGACVVAVSLAVGSLAPGYAALLLVLLVVGAGYSTVQPGGSKSVASWFDTSRRGLAMGIRQAGLPLGGVLAAAVLPALAASAGWRATLVAGAVVALLGAVTFTTFCHRPPLPLPHTPTDTHARSHSQVHADTEIRASTSTSDLCSPSAEPRPIPRPTGRPGSRSRASESSGRLRLLREPAMVRILVSGTSLVAVHSGIGALTVLHLHQTASLAPGTAALVFVAVQAAGAAGRICLAAWSDRSRSSTSADRPHQPSTSADRRHQPSTSADRRHQPSTSADRQHRLSTSAGRQHRLSTSADRPHRFNASEDHHRSNRSGRYSSVLACLVAVVAGLVALATPAGHSPVAASLLFVWLGFFGIGWYGPWVAHLAESAPPGRTGFALGAAMAVNQIAIILTPPALGLLKDVSHGFAPAWGLLAVLSAAALALTARTPSPRPRP
ncbi:MFS transporter [Nonomuraea wenchangensis]